MTPEQDRFTPQHSVYVLLFALFLWSVPELDNAFGIGLPFTILPVAMLVMAVVCWPIVVIWHLYRRRWRLFASALLAPLPAIALVAALAHAGLDPTWVRFQLKKDAFLEEIAQLPNDKKAPRLLSWQWDQARDATSSFAAMVYDESDEFARDSASHSVEWQQRLVALDQQGRSVPGYRQSSREDIRVRQIEGHFYLVEEIVD